jgi:beta-glucosidase
LISKFEYNDFISLISSLILFRRDAITMQKIKDLIAQMTLEDKAALCSGKDFWNLKNIDRLGILSIMVTDGPHGLRKQAGEADHLGLNNSVPATCFPTASALAATWNRDLVREVGVALGEECRQEKVGVILGPGANIKRSPLCGRNFEYFSEDPYLTGEIARSHISGVQSQGIGTSLKHYAANNQETLRMSSDSVVDERALREIYLTGFEIAVKEAQPWTVMCSYNKINGTYACEHPYLMDELLKKEWGHQGLVVTDWGAMNDIVAALKAGVELEMPGVPNGNADRIVAAVQSGTLEMSVLDQALTLILSLIFKASETLTQEYHYDAQKHHTLARRTAAEGAVLLKNEGGLLPLKKGVKIALIGRFAKEPRYQGAGSSLICPTRLENLYEELARLIGEENLVYAPGYSVKADAVDEVLEQEALAAAAAAEVVLICVGLPDTYEAEGIDRRHLRMPAAHDALIAKLAKAHPNVVVVLSNGSPVEMPWVNDVKAVLEGYLGGQAGAGALADLLTGKVNPSGKLAETFPLKLEDTPARPYPGGPAVVEYRESLYVGYRYYDTAKMEVLYPFGHGLSYTTFDYRDLKLTLSGERVTVSCKVKNSGPVAGKEVVQVYVSDSESSAFRPQKELKGFAKVELQPGEEKEVSIALNERAFAFYDSASKDWVIEPGDFEVMVGSSSRDIRLHALLQLSEGKGKAAVLDRTKLTSYFTPKAGQEFPLAEFESLLGHAVPKNERPEKGTYTMNTPSATCRNPLLAGSYTRPSKKKWERWCRVRKTP